MSQHQILGLGRFLKKSGNTIHVVYFRKALGTRTPKMIVPCVKYKNVETSSIYIWGMGMYVEQRGGAICCTWGGWGVSCREDPINDGSPSGGQIDVAWWAVVRNKINVDLRPFDWLSDQVRLSEPFLVAVMDCPCKLHMWSNWSVKVFEHLWWVQVR